MFFSRFSELSAEKGLSTTAAGREIGISKTTISYWRNNENVIPKNDVLQRIADYFGVSTDYLLGKTDIKNPPDQQSPEEIAKVALFGGDGEVTDEMWNEVKGFVAFIKDKRKRENGNN